MLSSKTGSLGSVGRVDDDPAGTRAREGGLFASSAVCGVHLN
jgi:hypothetical protein